MVTPVNRISSTSPSVATKVDSSVVSRAEPDNVWADERQAQINADLAAMKRFREEQGDVPAEEQPSVSPDDRHPHRRQDAATVDIPDPPADDDSKLSGESDRIGTRNFDDETPFGHRVLII